MPHLISLKVGRVPFEADTAQDAGGETVHDFAVVNTVITAVAEGLLGGIDEISATSATIEFGVRLSVKDDKLRTVLVDVRDMAAITVTVSWAKATAVNIGAQSEHLLSEAAALAPVAPASAASNAVGVVTSSSPAPAATNAIPDPLDQSTNG